MNSMSKCLNIATRCKIHVLFLFVIQGAMAQRLTPYEISNGKSSATLAECLSYYKGLLSAYPGYVQWKEPALGKSELNYHDAGNIKLITITNRNVHTPKVKIFICNAIHPGEPDGVDACMMLSRDVLTKAALTPLLDQVEINIIPLYNTGGAQKRGCCSRANQDGPEEYGFRANDLNLDLNRDFIKCDALETEVFESFFQSVRPHIFIDTHVSDGADYQYTLTLIASQHNKYENEVMENFQQQILMPQLYSRLENAGTLMIPYVDTYRETPDSGIVGFWDSPRYSTGYASLFNCFSFVTETHMLKPYDKRVKATYNFIMEMIKYAAEQKNTLINLQLRADTLSAQQRNFVLQWDLDTTRYTMIPFKGYKALYKPSKVTGKDQLVYDRSQPYTKPIRFYDEYTPVKSVKAPDCYAMPYEWFYKLNLTRLALNFRVVKDTELVVTTYRIRSSESSKRAYESHFTHFNTQVDTATLKQKMTGAWVFIPLDKNPRFKRYLIQALEPESNESFFAWTMIDNILQQKEGFSDYVWDHRAEEILDADPELRRKLEERKETDEAFRNNARAQLEYVYRHSTYFEKSYMLYPVFRIETK